MSRDEIEVTRWGEMLDMIACEAIYNGIAKQKKPKKRMEEVLAMR